MTSSRRVTLGVWGAIVCLVAGLAGCRPLGRSEGEAGGSAGREAGAASGSPALGGHLTGCLPLAGTPWVPKISVSSQSLEAPSIQAWLLTGPILGAAQGLYRAAEVDFSFELPEDLGPEGSFVLSAQVENVPRVMESGVTPVLISLHDGEEEFIKLPRGGAAGDCSRAGFYVVASNEKLSRNSNCRLQPGSAYADDTSWWRAQDLTNDRSVSVNTFPTCRFAPGEPGCAFSSARLGAEGRLRFGPGVVYRGKYVLLARRYQTVPEESLFANLKITLVKKPKRPSREGSGVLNIDLVLVGSENIQASRTAKGARNLQTLIGLVQKHFAQANAGISLGRVRSVEWTCEEGGDAFAHTPIQQLSQVFREGSRFASRRLGESAPLTDALRIFLVSAIENEQDGRIFLGVSGALGGPLHVGTGASGVAFGTFGSLAKFNPECDLLRADVPECTSATLDPSFVDLAATMSHEMGHFLGLAHLSESTAIVRDPLPDTPACTMLERRGALDVLTARSCSQDANPFIPTGRSCFEVCSDYDGQTRFCPEAVECEFNHVMWWTAKGYDPRQERGDGNFFSPDSGAQLRLSPFVR